MIVTDGNRGSLEGPCLVEIAGVAGAGKSTLARRLSRGEGDVRVGDFIHTRTPAHLRYVVHSLPRIAPILAGTLGPGPRLSWPEAKLLVYVTEWHRFLCSRAEYEGGVTLLDQGPLYALVRLKAQGKNVTGRAAFERWWNEMLEQWASHLDLVVWLDAPDAVLWERINGRDQRTRRSAPRARRVCASSAATGRCSTTSCGASTKWVGRRCSVSIPVACRRTISPRRSSRC